MIFLGWDNESDDITKDITVTALWKPIPNAYVVRTEVENGAIDPMIGVMEGEDVTIKFSPKDGYELKKIIIDGEEIEIEDGMTEYTFKNVDKEHDIKVVYEKVKEEKTPTTPSNKETPKKSNTANSTKKATPVKTGDNANVLPYILLAVLAAGTAVGVTIKKKAASKK